MRQIAIYDLDRTITVRPTFTPFLLFAARRIAPYRLVFLPLWIAGMLGYKAKLYQREQLKNFGMRLFIGRRLAAGQAANIAEDFVAKTVANNIAPGAAQNMQADKVAGIIMLMSTAASEIYAELLAQKLGFTACIATRQRHDEHGNILAVIDGTNNYGAEKLRRTSAWIAEQGWARSELHITFYSDHESDAPLLDWADEGVLIGGASLYAKTQGWTSRKWS